MRRGALYLGASLWVLAPCAGALAHGVPPEAYAVLSQDAEGPRAVSLSAGVALRRSAQRYQFVCPMAWGDQFVAPVAALADGSVLVGASHGLMLLGEDATLRVHPDPAAVGRSSEVVRSAQGVFALRSTAAGSEILAADAQVVRVIWKGPQSQYSLAALDDKLVLVRATENVLEQVTLAAASGVELERRSAVVEFPVDYVFARAAAGVAYTLVVFRNGTMTLGTLGMNTFTKLAEGELSIAGPLAVGNATLLAVDGKLMQLVGGQLMPLVDDHGVVCLSEHDGVTYACENNGIARLREQVLGEPLFRFGWLMPPDLALVPEGEQRFMCNAQWQDLLLDMQLLAPDLANLPPEPPPTAGGAAPLPGMMLPAAGSAPQAGVGGSVVVPEPPRENGSSCAAVSGRGALGATGAHRFVLVLVLVLVLARLPASCRRRRQRDRPSPG